MERVPAGYTRAVRFAGGEVWTHENGGIVVLGSPYSTPNDDDPDAHNCDAMGCGLDHVVFKATLPKPPPADLIRVVADTAEAFMVGALPEEDLDEVVKQYTAWKRDPARWDGSGG